MTERIFLAGAAGAIGRRLCPLLLHEGWQVTGTTRSPERAAQLAALGVQPAIVDVYDGPALSRAVIDSGASIVVHQLTDLPPLLDPAQMAAGRVRNAQLREVGTRNLVAAAVAAGAARLIAQSVAFAYATGPQPHEEDAPLDPGATAVASLEQQVLSAPLFGVVLRFGRFYGPGTGSEHIDSGPAVHIDAAADATRCAILLGEPGVYNIAEEDGSVDSSKARTLLRWDSGYRSA